MSSIFYEGQVIWAQLDPNRHVRHSAYADYCAQARSNMLNQLGLSLQEFAKHQIGPILFREELIYKREIGLDEQISVSVELVKYNVKNSRFSFRHEVIKADGVVAAVVHVDGAWMDLQARKLTRVPESWDQYIEKVPRASDYEEIND